MGEARTKTMRGSEIKKPNREMFSQRRNQEKCSVNSYQTADADHIDWTGPHFLHQRSRHMTPNQDKVAPGRTVEAEFSPAVSP